MSLRPTRARLLAAGALLLAVVAFTVARATSGSSTPERWTPEQSKVQADYLAYWDALLKANATADPATPGLAEHAASNQLEVLKANLTHLGSQGAVAKGQVGHAVRAVAVDQQVSHLTDCVDIKGWIQYDSRTGTQRPGQLLDRPSQLVVYTLALRDSAWIVTDSRTVGDC